MGGPAQFSGDKCHGPCIDVNSWQYERNASTSSLERGQEVTVYWSRNNHEGGFVRFSLVPAHLRMSHEAHNRLAFHFSCFDSGAAKCDIDTCGDDNNDLVLKAKIRIPTIYPGTLSKWFVTFTPSLNSIAMFRND